VPDPRDVDRPATDPAPSAALVDLDVFELSGVGMAIADRTGVLHRVNPAFARLLGRPPAQLIGVSFASLTDPEDLDASRQAMYRLLTRTAEALRLEKRYVLPDGSAVWVDLNLRSLLGADGEVAGFLVQGVDVSDRRLVQQSLIEATQEAHRLALVARVAPSAIIIADPTGRIDWVNDSFTRLSGYEPEEAIGRTRMELLHGPGVGSAELAEFHAKAVRGDPADGEFSLTAKDGRPYWAHVQVRPVVEDGEVVRLVGVEQDVSSRKQTEEALRAAGTRAERLAEDLRREKELLAGVISAVPQMVFWKDADHRYVGCNTAYLTFCGCSTLADLQREGPRRESEADGQIAAVLDELEEAALSRGEGVVDRQVTANDQDGVARMLLLSVLPLGEPGAPQGVVGVAADITQVREMERQLSQTSRLESIGQLAAGIAHEINTPVQYLASNSRFLGEAITSLIATTCEIDDLSRRVEPGDDDCAAARARMRELLDALDLPFLAEDVPNALAESREGLARLTQIVRAMKDYAHPGTHLEDIDINQAVETTVQVCRNEWKYVADLRMELDPDAGALTCYPGELKQVILNIVVNAAQALADQREAGAGRGLGTIVVSTRRTPEELVITIADDGPGIPESIRARVFDPFFTTKGIGKGTGQGLSLARSVVVGKHHGRIAVTSTPGQGARFTIGLPLHAAAPDQD
jgi:two-component system, NtrC family, sensor kinase